MSEHTEGPLYFDGGRYIREESTDGCIAMVCEDDGHVNPRARVAYPTEENGRRLALCWNTHDDLLEALQEAKLSIESGLESDDDDLEAEWSKEDKKLLAKINAAIAKAKGEA